MEIKELRSSFQVAIVDAHDQHGQEINELLTSENYTNQIFHSNENFLRQLSKNPPHVLIYVLSQELDPQQINTDTEFMTEVLRLVPECHVIVMSDAPTMDYALTFYDKGGYDLISLPMVGVEQLLQAIDRAFQTDYYHYLNEQLRSEAIDSSDETRPPTAGLELAMMSRWNQQLIQMHSYSEVVSHLCREIQSRTQKRVIYFKYLNSQAVLVAAHCEGMSFEDIRGVGVNLIEEDENFFRDQLHLPASINGLRKMLKTVFHIEDYCALSIVAKEAVFGTVIVLEEDQKLSGDEYIRFMISLAEERCAGIEAETQLRKLQISDKVTNTLEHSVFYDELKREISRSRRIGLPVSLAIFELKFKTEKNQTLSTTDKDIALMNVAELLKRGCRSYDKIGRIGATQFAVLLIHASKKNGAIKAERLRREIESLMFEASIPNLSQIEASVGVSEYPSLGHDADAILNSADEALSVVLEGGRNRVCLASVGTAFVPDFIV